MLDLLVVGLATHRAWLLYHQPNGLLAPLRAALGRLPIAGYGFTCAACTLVQIGLVMTIAWQYPYVRTVVWALAAASVAGISDLLNGVMERLSRP